MPRNKTVRRWNSWYRMCSKLPERAYPLRSSKHKMVHWIKMTMARETQLCTSRPNHPSFSLISYTSQNTSVGPNTKRFAPMASSSCDLCFCLSWRTGDWLYIYVCGVLLTVGTSAVLCGSWVSTISTDPLIAQVACNVREVDPSALLFTYMCNIKASVVTKHIATVGLIFIKSHCQWQSCFL
ncbi:uncharacterized protein EI90DRAFT_259952 [Cantharellus anzutake]|uniref:uncharacterized protein n=1 Tax=Cantharellus anzutake TaxID=1750568 RepID=UPI0019074FC9|nr:uncharacterized protein EI90DRAFT_259952 [Cantharellus anzutake]KAF8335805.1 hypothetical protein EI90DRAFT_259952 [Cantharellus anzutake]